MLLDDPEIFRCVVDSLQTGIYITDCEHRIVFWNSGAEQITGFLRHEMVGRYCREQVLVHCNEAGTNCRKPSGTWTTSTSSRTRSQ